MEEKDKMSGSDFVNTMAQLGEKHAKMIADTLQTVADEVAEQTDEKKLKDVHPIFVSAGHGAYHGAMEIMMKKTNPIFAALRRNSP